MIFVFVQNLVHRQHRGGVALGPDQPGAEIEFVGTHRQDGVVELARQRQRVPVDAGGFDGGDIGGLFALRRAHGKAGGARPPIHFDGDVFVTQRVFFHASIQRRQADTLAVGRAVALRSQLQRALPDRVVEHCRFGDGVDQAPVPGALTAHALGGGAKDVRQVVAHVALVGDPRQAPGAGQDAEQRHFGQADRARAVVDQDDFVAGQRQFVSAAGAGAVDRGDELEAAVL